MHKIKPLLGVMFIGATLPGAVVMAESAMPAARIGDTVITVREVDASIQDKIYEANQALFEARDEVLRELVNERLLEQAALKEGLSVDEYMERQLTADDETVSDEQVSALLQRAGLDESMADDRQRLLARLYLVNKLQEDRQAALFAELSERYGVKVLLKPPRVPESMRASIQGPQDLARGVPDAAVTMVLFSDFDCGFCGRLQPTLRKLEANYPQQLRVVYRHYPLAEFDSDGGRAAEAAQCAADQGRFWEYHDALYRDGDMSRDGLHATATSLDLDMSKFDNCLEDHRHKARIEADIAEGERLEVTGTPTVFINGIRVEGAEDYAVFSAHVEAEISDRAGPEVGTAAHIEKPAERS